MDKYSLLRQYFGHSDFRGGQEALIDGILSGRDVLGVMPTGGGKSICYQIPALLLPGLSVVISPLISLMKDQVASLQSAGVPAAFVNSAMTQEEYRAARDAVRTGRCRILYVAPERLDNESFLAFIARRQVSLIAVDEAHCISQWGQDFRPSYLRIAAFAAGLPQRPVVAAFTATATQRVQEDILQRLELRDPLRVVTGFDRPNLFFDVLQPKKKLQALLALMASRRDKSGIVYCATRAKVDQVWNALREAGFHAARYHAGLEDEERRQNQEDFQLDRSPVMVATNAFGMGIDKSSVSFVIHYNMPKDLESYYQEAGRAGRDGAPADCILLYSPGDIYTAKFLISHSSSEWGEDDEARAQRQELQRLDVMAGYCKTSGCLRGYLLEYFGQPHQDHCDSCGSCRGEQREEDITIPAQMILSCVKRVQGKLGYFVGPALIQRVLRGSRDKRIHALGLDQLSTFGLMKDRDRRLVQEYLDCLQAKGYLFVEETHGTLRPTPQADGVLFRGERVTMRTRGDRQRLPPPAEPPRQQDTARQELPETAGGVRPAERQPQDTARRKLPGAAAEVPVRRGGVPLSAAGDRPVPRGPAAEPAAPPPVERTEAPPAKAAAPDPDPLLAALREKRTQLARDGQVPAYIICNNATLADMAQKLPQNIEELLLVSGMGEIKAQRYGSEFLSVIARWRAGRG